MGTGTVTTAPLPLALACTLPSAQVGIAYSGGCTVSGGTGPFTYSLNAKSFSPLSLNSSTGVLSGVPQVPETYSIEIVVTDSGSPVQTASQTQFAFKVLPAGLTISCGQLGDAVTGVPFAGSCTAAGGIQPFTFSVSAGAPPSGLLFYSTGQLVGTPTVPSTSSFSITVTDSSSPAQTATQSIPNFFVSTETLALKCFIDIDDARLGVPYNEGCSASGGTAPPTDSISSGILPRGLIFNPASGVLKGIPLVSGPFPITVKAVDSAPSPVSVSRTISDFVILPYKPLFLACDVPLFQTVGVPFMGFATGFCGASFGIAPYTDPISSGTAPPGLSIDPSGGQIVGTLTTAGIYVIYRKGN